jgi:serine/threonine-protein kinase
MWKTLTRRTTFYKMGATVIGGRYVLQRQLGQGGQGDVYQALDSHEGDVVAIKLLRGLPPSGQWVEAQILRRLSDAHILPIRNADVAAGQPYLVTELAQHGTLEARLGASGGSGLDVDDVVGWIRDACHGVARAHDLRLVHNDLKPANLFLDANAECLVGDFGAAALIPPGATQTMPPMATAETAAPIATGWNTPATTASFRSDVYSLGATAYWLLAARTAHDFGALTDTTAKMAVVASQIPPRLRDVAPHVPTQVAAAIERALARNPADRFATVLEFGATLGSRRALLRPWQRTDQHPAHVGCWTGVPRNGGSTYVLCLEPGPRATQLSLVARHAGSGNRITQECRVVPARSWAQAVRAAIGRLT